MATVEDFDVRVDALPAGGVVVRITGDLDLATAPELEPFLDDASPPVVVDLSGCSFVDSSGVRALVAAAGRVRHAGGRLALVVADPGVRRVLEITSADEIVSIHPTIDSALSGHVS